MRPLGSSVFERFALWELGFRPFFLFASLFAVASVGLWTAQLSGWFPGAYLRSSIWHGHEMLFGYALAVVAGFLLTAVRNWTGMPTAQGAPLMALVALWIAGRMLVLTPYAIAAALVNTAFPLALGVAIGVPLVRSRNVRNYFFLGLLVLVAATIALLHLALLGFALPLPRPGLVLGLDVILFIMVVMGGRVIPTFTNSGVSGAGATRNRWVEHLSLGSILALLTADFFALPIVIVVGLALTAAVLHAVRLALWRGWRTLGTPLVWILHASYAWIVVHLIMRALAAPGLIADSLAIHALTVGAIGGLTIGMMSRVARGHTGRPLLADGFDRAMFVIVQAAAAVRVFGGMAPEGFMPSVQVSGILWAIAFGLYTVRYWPVLIRPRLDGKPR